MALAVVICHTDGCGNAGHPITLDITNPDTGEQITPVICGVCGNPITDIADSPEDA